MNRVSGARLAVPVVPPCPCPANAGIQSFPCFWPPAFAGVTMEGTFFKGLLSPKTTLALVARRARSAGYAALEARGAGP
jgi:hypothetical protein